MTLLAFGISLYALSFFVRGQAAFPPDLRDSFNARVWGIYGHVFFGGIALAIGPFQFRRGLLLGNRPLHRRLGLAYVIASAMTGVSGMYNGRVLARRHGDAPRLRAARLRDVHDRAQAVSKAVAA